MSKQQDELRIVEVPDKEYGKRYKLIGADNKVIGMYLFLHNAEKLFESIESHTNSAVQAALDKVEATNLKGMYIDPHKTAGVLVAEHRIVVQNTIEEVRKDYE